MARRRRKVRLVLLCDVSGSMDLYSRFLLQFLFALQSVFGRVETFAFSTRLTRITADTGSGEWGAGPVSLTVGSRGARVSGVVRFGGGARQVARLPAGSPLRPDSTER